MNHSELLKQIKNKTTERAYIFFGKEKWAKDRALNQLKQALMPNGLDVFGYTELGDSTSIIQMKEACDTLPMMCEKRMVVCVADTLISKEEKQLCEYLKMLPETCCLVLVVQDEKSRIPKKIKDNVTVVEFSAVDETQMGKFLCKKATNVGVELPLKTAVNLFRMTGNDPLRSENELDKLCHYAKQSGIISDFMLNDVVMASSEYNVFTMIDAFLNQKYQEGIKLLEKMLDAGESPIGLCNLLAGRFRSMIRAKSLLQSGGSEAAVIKALGGSAYAAKKAVAASSKFSFTKLTECIEILLDCDKNVKTGKMPQKMALEYALVKMFNK